MINCLLYYNALLQKVSEIFSWGGWSGGFGARWEVAAILHNGLIVPGASAQGYKSTLCLNMLPVVGGWHKGTCVSDWSARLFCLACWRSSWTPQSQSLSECEDGHVLLVH